MTTQYNYLPTNTFTFVLGRLPAATFYAQRMELPSISANYPDLPFPGANQPVFSDKLTYSDLSITFIVDENMLNYIELFKWLQQQKAYTSFVPTDSEPQYSDGHLSIMTSSSNQNKVVKFKKMFPVSLSEIQFDTTQTETQYATCTAAFKFSDMEFSDFAT